jgi:hypothetical protein
VPVDDGEGRVLAAGMRAQRTVAMSTEEMMALTRDDD